MANGEVFDELCIIDKVLGFFNHGGAVLDDAVEDSGNEASHFDGAKYDG